MTQRRFSPGEDAQVIAEIAKRHFGGFEPMFEYHGWPERGSEMMRKVQTRVVETYGSVRAFEEHFRQRRGNDADTSAGRRRDAGGGRHMTRKVIVTCAVTGSADTMDRNPAVPVTPAEIASSAIDAARAGAAIVHVHVRDPETKRASMKLEHYIETARRIRESDTDVVLNLTTGYGARLSPGLDDPFNYGPGTTLASPARRIRHVLALQPEICSLDVATMNSGGVRGHSVMINSPPHLRAMADAIREVGVVPELEVFDVGHVRLAAHLIESGYVEAPGFFQLCLGIQWGAPATPEALSYMKSLLPSGAHWAAFGIGRDQLPTIGLSVLHGGHVRTGLEDNLYLARGRLAHSNAALVEQAVTLIRMLGAEPATPAEAREILGTRN